LHGRSCARNFAQRWRPAQEGVRTHHRHSCQPASYKDSMCIAAASAMHLICVHVLYSGHACGRQLLVSFASPVSSEYLKEETNKQLC
jgi:hypothetical protein